MTPVNKELAELLLAIGQAERRGVATLLDAALKTELGGPELRADVLEDHRVAVAGDLADALDNIQPGLGRRWMQAMYPELDYTLSADDAASAIVEMLAARQLYTTPAPGTDTLQ
jgi:hypothetical protein